MFMNKPSPILVCAIMGMQAIVTIFCGFGIIVSKANWDRIGLTWLYCFVCLIILDVVKLAGYNIFREGSGDSRRHCWCINLWSMWKHGDLHADHTEAEIQRTMQMKRRNSIRESISRRSRELSVVDNNQLSYNSKMNQNSLSRTNQLSLKMAGATLITQDDFTSRSGGGAPRPSPAVVALSPSASSSATGSTSFPSLSSSSSASSSSASSSSSSTSMRPQTPASPTGTSASHWASVAAAAAAAASGKTSPPPAYPSISIPASSSGRHQQTGQAEPVSPSPDPVITVFHPVPSTPPQSSTPPPSSH